MPDRGSPSASRFSATFPRRFAAALADAQGAIAGIAASAQPGGVIGSEAMRKLHEIYRLRVELEIETAGMLWRTSEVVAALADAIDVLGRRGDPGPGEAAPFLGSLTPDEIASRRRDLDGGDERTARRASWPQFTGRAPAVPPSSAAELLKFPPVSSMPPSDTALAA